MKPLITVLGICILLAGGTSVRATTYDWSGEENSSWSLDTNWTGYTVPTSGAIVIDENDLIGNKITTCDYDKASGTESYDSLTVISDSDTAMTFKKSGAATLTFDTMTLQGYDSSYRSTLDVNEDGLSVTYTVDVSAYVDIEVATGKSTSIGTTLQVGSEDSNYEGTLTVSDGGSITVGTLVIQGDTGGSGSSMTVVDSTTLSTS